MSSTSQIQNTPWTTAEGPPLLIYKNTKQNDITDWDWWWFVPLTWSRSQWPCHRCHSHLNTVTSYLWFPEYEQCATLPPFTVLFWELQCWMWHGLYTIEQEVFNGYARPKVLSSSFAAPCTNALSTRCLMFWGTDIFSVAAWSHDWLFNPLTSCWWNLKLHCVTLCTKLLNDHRKL